MLKDIDDPKKESAEQKAARMWRNYDLTKRFLEDVNRESIEAPPKVTPDIAEVFETERRIAGSVTRFERKFVKDFKAMLEGHRRRNVALYRLALLSRLDKLKRERLRRLEALQARRPKSKDLFA